VVGKQYAPALSSLQSAPALLEWLCQEQYGSGLTASCLQKWGMAPYVARECGAEEQNIDHVAFHYPIHWPTHGASGLTVLVTRQPNGCSTLATRSSVAYQWIRTHSNNEEVIELTVNVNLYWGRVRSCQGQIFVHFIASRNCLLSHAWQWIIRRNKTKDYPWQLLGCPQCRLTFRLEPAVEWLIMSMPAVRVVISSALALTICFGFNSK